MVRCLFALCDVLQEGQRSFGVSTRIFAVRSIDGEPAAIVGLGEQRDQFWPIDFAAAEDDFLTGAVNVADAIARGDVQDMLVQFAIRGDGIAAAHGEDRWIEVDADQPLGDLGNQFFQIGSRVASGRDGQRGADSVAVPSDIAEHVDQQLVVFGVLVGRNRSDTGDDDRDVKLVGELQRLLQTGDAGLDLFGVVKAPPSREGERRNRQSFDFQVMSQLSSAAVREVSRSQFLSGIELNSGRPQFDGGMNRSANWLRQTMTGDGSA